MKLRTKTVFLSVFAVFAAVFLTLGAAVAVGARAESVEYDGGNISFKKDFTALDPYDMSWQEDPAVFDFGGDLTVTPNTIRALGCGKRNVSSKGAGYVSYLIEVPEGNIITSLGWLAHGRVYHRAADDDACATNTCDCGYDVAVSVDGGQTFKSVVNMERPPYTGSEGGTFQYDLTPIACGYRSAIVKLYMSGKNWDRIHMKDIEISGTYEEGEEPEPRHDGDVIYDNGEFTMTRDFTVLSPRSKEFAEDKAVYDFSDGLIVTPDSVRALGMDRSLSMDGPRYISYIFNAPEGNLFKTAQIAWHGRAYHSTSNSTCASGECLCELKFLLSCDGGATWEVAKDYDIPSGKSTLGQSFEVPLTSLVEGKGSFILGIQLWSQSWDWVHISDLAVTGTYEADGRIFERADEYDYRFAADYTSLEAYDRSWQSDADSFDFMEIGPDGGALGVGKEGEGSSGTGYVTYKISAPENNLISEARIFFTGRVFHYTGSGDCEADSCGCGLRIYVSDNNESWKLAGEEKPGLSGSFNVGFSHDLTEEARGAKDLYVKLELTTKNWNWASLQTVDIYGNYRDASVGVDGASLVPLRADDRLTTGDSFVVTAKINNEGSEKFDGTVEIIAPSYSFKGERTESISLGGGESIDCSFELVASEGGFNSLFVEVKDGDGMTIDRYELKVFIGGEGFYLGDPHHQSFESDGRNSFYDNFSQLAEKGFSFAITADHNAKNPTDSTAQQQAAKQIREQFGVEFTVLKGAEVTTAGNAHVLAYNHKTEFEVLGNSQQVIDEITAQGGLTFLAHPFLPNYLFAGLGEDPTNVDAISGMTGVELLNGETNWVRGQDGGHTGKNFEYWDRMNLKGEKKYFGTGGSDAHDSIVIGSVGDVFLSEDLGEEELLKAFATGKFYVTTGPALRFGIGDKTFGESVGVRGATKETVSVSVYDPDYAIEKVMLYKFVIDEDIDSAYKRAMDNAVVLYERADDTIHAFDYESEIYVRPGEFYRVVVYTESGSLNWLERSASGMAVGNPIWIEKEMTDLKITKTPRTLYEQRAIPDYSGLELTATYYDGTSAPVKGWWATGFDTSEVGEHKVTILYNGKTAEYDYTVTEEQGIVRYEDNALRMTRDYKKLLAGDAGWKNDEAVYRTGGDLVVSGGAGLAVSGASSSVGYGYVDWEISLPAGNIVDELKVIVNGEAAEGGKISVSVSTNGGITFIPVGEFGREAGSITATATDKVESCGLVIVRIRLDGKGSYVSDIEVEGTYKEGEAIAVPPEGSVLAENGTIVYEKDFSTLPQYDMSWKNDAAVFETGGDLTISPNNNSMLGVGRQNVSSSGSGYVSYLVEVPEGNVFKALSLTLTGRIYHSTSNAECGAGECDCGVEVLVSVDGGKLYKKAFEQKADASKSLFTNVYTVDLGEYTANKNSVVIKIMMTGKSWNWVGFKTISVNGEYDEGEYIPDLTIESVIKEDWSALGVGNDEEWRQKTETWQNLRIGNGEKPWLGVVPGSDGTWNNVVGKLVYRLSNGAPLEEVTVRGTARVFSFENSTARFTVKYSFDGVDYKVLKDFKPTTSGGELAAIDLSLAELLNGEREVWIMFELESGYWDWVCVRDIEISAVSVAQPVKVTVWDGAEEAYTNKFHPKGTAFDYTPAEKEGYRTTGLYTDAACTELYEGEAIESDTELYVGREAIKYTVTFEFADEEAREYTIETGLELPVPTKEGYTFEGWYSDSEFASRVESIEKGETGDKTLYAKWSENGNTSEPGEEKVDCSSCSGSASSAMVIVSMAAFAAFIAKRRK